MAEKIITGGDENLEQLLLLLGSGREAYDRTLEAARMRAHLTAGMTERMSGVALAPELENDLALVFLCLNDALSEGSLCAGEARWRRLHERFSEVFAKEGAPVHARFDEAVDALTKAGIVREVEKERDRHALLLSERDGSEMRLYTARSFGREEALAAYAAELARGTQDEPAVSPQEEPGRAVRLACKNRFTIISGGPGTGKTTTVVKILKELLIRNPSLDVLLAAPTGKAASRMKEAIAAQAATIEDAALRERLTGLVSQTLHRALLTPAADGSRPGKMSPLDYDVIVVDESSMIDIGLAVRLFESIDAGRTKVILLGDRHQLAAVGPGSVFGDMSDPAGALSANISHLTKSHRFSSEKTLGRLAAGINEGNVTAVKEELKRAQEPDLFSDNEIALHSDMPHGELSESFRRWLDRRIRRIISEIEKTAVKGKEPEVRRLQAAKAMAGEFASTGILAANRNGPMSVNAVNSTCEEAFADAGLPHPLFRPVIVRRNDPTLSVFNGDTGVVVPAADWFEGAPFDSAKAEVYFPDTERFVPYGQISEMDPAFAVTIHQSQGSEYHRVAVLMPVDPGSPLCVRELFYTAVTRVKDLFVDVKKTYGTLDIFAPAGVIGRAVASAVEREGGLKRRLSEAAAETEN